jgi:hypothetical protein
MKKIRGDKLIGVIIHTCTETLQGNSLYLKQAKMTCFSFSLLQNPRTGGWNTSCQGGGLAPVGGGR